MRTLVITRGCPASGKSTWIKESGLEQYTLSADSIRTIIQSPVMNEEGKYEISQKNDKKVWEMLFQLMEERMKRGEFIVIDATHNNDKLIKRYKDYCDTYKYSIFVKEFRVPLEECIERNSKRDEYKFVPVESIKRCYRNIELQPTPSFCRKIDNISEISNFYVEDFSQYEKIVFIGDIHGCYNPLKKVFDKFNEYDKTAYVFLGDYIDRGLQNREVLEFMLSVYSRKNVFCLEGNHENVLLNFSKGVDSGKKYFEKNTKPSLDGIDLKSVRMFYKKLRQCLKISFHDKKFLVTHGGLPINPKNITYLSTEQIIRGVGDYNTEIDKIYQSNKDFNDGYIQIHGHRNLKDDQETSISLEDEIEFGGNLKVLEVTKDNMEIHLFENDLWDRNLLKVQEYRRDTPKLNTQSQEINDLSTSTLIKTKLLGDNIASINFTSNAFKKKAWNYQTVKARGLFVDTVTGDVVARSYEKFFNLHELEETKPRNLKRNLVFPVNIFLKDNGYLGMVSHRNGEFIFCSKSTNQGEHSEWLKNIFIEYCGDKYNDILDCVIKNNITLVFEVIDTANDPHIIKYDKNKLVLLNTFENNLKTNKDKGLYEILEIIKGTKIEYKVKLATIDTYDDLMNYIDEHDNLDKTEGIVVEDSNGFMFKVKYKYYNDWKSCRYILDNIKKNRGYFEIRISNSDTQAQFGMWFSKNFCEEMCEKSLIELRDMFNNM